MLSASSDKCFPLSLQPPWLVALSPGCEVCNYLPCWVVQWPGCLHWPCSHGKSTQCGMYGRMEHSITQNYPQEKWRALCDAQKPKEMQGYISERLSEWRKPSPANCPSSSAPAARSSPGQFSIEPNLEKHITCIQVTDNGWNEAGQSADQMIRHADFDYTSVRQETWKQLSFLQLPLNFKSS